jgi:hypothetical protein
MLVPFAWGKAGTGRPRGLRVTQRRKVRRRNARTGRSAHGLLDQPTDGNGVCGVAPASTSVIYRRQLSWLSAVDLVLGSEMSRLTKSVNSNTVLARNGRGTQERHMFIAGFPRLQPIVVQVKNTKNKTDKPLKTKKTKKTRQTVSPIGRTHD